MTANALQTIGMALGLLPPGDLNFKPYDYEDLVILFGTPPIQLGGLDSITAKRLHSPSVFKPNFGGGGLFLSNRNISGEVRLRFIGASWSLGHIEIFDALGAPVPFLVTDIGSGGTSTVVGAACKVVDKGEWTRGAEAPMVEITLQADKLWFFHGVRLLNS